MDTAWGESMKRGVSFLNQCIATELLFSVGQCAGAMIFLEKKGEFVRILSRATVLATGGSGQVFKVTTNCRQNTGDGLAIVLQAGLPILDPEAVQFHPTGIVGPGILASETLRSVGGILRNKALEPCMEHYAPKMKELAPRDLVARAIEMEIREGRGVLNPDHNIEHVWIDLRHLPQNVHEEQIPEVSGFFKKYVNLDPRRELCPVRPSNHYHMGGIPTNIAGQVLNGSQRSIPGLYAVGECAAASFHGFNRLGTNSILELITMGKSVGESVLKFLEETPQNPAEASAEKSFSLFSDYLEGRGTDNIGKIRDALRTLMTAKVGVFRTESGISDAIDTLKELKERAQKVSLSNRSLAMNQELIQRWELDNLLAVSLVIARAALARKESRGAHFREDFPERKDEYNHHTLASMPVFGDVVLDRRAVDMSVFSAGGENCEKFNLIERKY
jgi:succinate dehydrogenase / fumarate reductase flavoprotein subunit